MNKLNTKSFLTQRKEIGAMLEKIIDEIINKRITIDNIHEKSYKYILFQLEEALSCCKKNKFINVKNAVEVFDAFRKDEDNLLSSVEEKNDDYCFELMTKYFEDDVTWFKYRNMQNNNLYEEFMNFILHNKDNVYEEMNFIELYGFSAKNLICERKFPEILAYDTMIVISQADMPTKVPEIVENVEKYFIRY